MIKIRDKIKADLQYIIRRNTDVSQSEIDRLQLLSAASSDSLPELFSNVLKYLANNHAQNPPKDNLHEVTRLLKILTTAEELSELQPLQPHEEDLIPKFMLTGEEIERISNLCQKMRQIIHSANQFDQPHKIRLLNRIAAIEVEILKPKGMFDVVRGGIDDLGETLGTFGTNIKPLTDRMKEVVGIARRRTKEYDQLPAPEDVKQLPPPASENDGNEE